MSVLRRYAAWIAVLALSLYGLGPACAAFAPATPPAACAVNEVEHRCPCNADPHAASECCCKDSPTAANACRLGATTCGDLAPRLITGLWSQSFPISPAPSIATRFPSATTALHATSDPTLRLNPRSPSTPPPRA